MAMATPRATSNVIPFEVIVAGEETALNEKEDDQRVIPSVPIQAWGPSLNQTSILTKATNSSGGDWLGPAKAVACKPFLRDERVEETQIYHNIPPFAATSTLAPVPEAVATNILEESKNIQPIEVCIEYPLDPSNNIAQTETQQNTFTPASSLIIENKPIVSSTPFISLKSSLIPQEQIYEAKDLVCRGGMLWKIPFNSFSGGPKRRWFVVNISKLGKAELGWHDPEKPSQRPRSIDLAEVTELVKGQVTQAFFGSSSEKLPAPSLCFSLILPERTLDLAANSSTDLLLWLKGLRHYAINATFKENLIMSDITPNMVITQKVNTESVMMDLFDACYNNDILKFTEILEEYEVDIDSIEPGSSMGDSCLVIACKAGHVKIAELCLRYGASNDPHPTYGQTALQAAISNGQVICAKLLLDTAKPSGSDEIIVNDVDHKGSTALHNAATRKDVFLLQLLLKHGADMTVLNNQGQTALHRITLSPPTGLPPSVQRDRLRGLQILLDHGGDELVNISDDNGNTALHFAVHTGDELLVKTLLESAANPLLKNHHEFRPYHIAQSKQLPKIMTLLREYESWYSDENANLPKTTVAPSYENYHQNNIQKVTSDPGTIPSSGFDRDDQTYSTDSMRWNSTTHNQGVPEYQIPSQQFPHDFKVATSASQTYFNTSQYNPSYHTAINGGYHSQDHGIQMNQSSACVEYTEMYTNEGYAYYINHITGVSQWEDPRKIDPNCRVYSSYNPENHYQTQNTATPVQLTSNLNGDNHIADSSEIINQISDDAAAFTASSIKQTTLSVGQRIRAELYRAREAERQLHLIDQELQSDRPQDQTISSYRKNDLTRSTGSKKLESSKSSRRYSRNIKDTEALSNSSVTSEDSSEDLSENSFSSSYETKRRKQRRSKSKYKDEQNRFESSTGSEAEIGNVRSRSKYEKLKEKRKKSTKDRSSNPQRRKTESKENDKFAEGSSFDSIDDELDQRKNYSTVKKDVKRDSKKSSKMKEDYVEDHSDTIDLCDQADEEGKNDVIKETKSKNDSKKIETLKDQRSSIQMLVHAQLKEKLELKQNQPSAEMMEKLVVDKKTGKEKSVHENEDVNSNSKKNDDPCSPKQSSQGKVNFVEKKAIDISKYDKYIKMRSVGIGQVAVKQKMIMDGINDESVISFVLETPIKEVTTHQSQKSASSPSMSKQSDHPVQESSENIDQSPKISREEAMEALQAIDGTEKYLKMKKMGLPPASIRQKMMLDSMSQEAISLFEVMCGLDENDSTKSKPTKASVTKPSRTLVKLHWNTLMVQSRENTVWAGKASDDLPEDDIKELEEIFAAKKPSEVNKLNLKGSKQSNPGKKQGRASVVSSKREANVGIGLSQFRKRFGTDFDKIAAAIDGADTTTLETAQLQILVDLLPTDEERSLVNDALKRLHGSEEAFLKDASLVERFFLSMNRVNQPLTKVNGILFLTQFPEISGHVQMKLTLLASACAQIKSSARLQQVFTLILSIGNFINGAESDGFTLDSLLKLKETRGNDSTSVIDYLCKVAHRKGGEELLSFDEDLNDVEPASRLVPGDLSRAVQSIKSQRDSLFSLIQAQGEESIFSRNLESRLKGINPIVESLGQLELEVKEAISRTVAYLGERESCTAQHMFSVLNEFIKSFATARTKLRAKLKREALQQMQN